MRGLLGSLGVLLGMNLLTKPLWLLVEQDAQNALGHADYGTFQALMSLAFILRVVGEAGLDRFAARQVAAHQRQYAAVQGGAFQVKLLLNFAYLLLLLGVGYALGYRGIWLGFLALAGGWHALLNFLDQLRAAYQAHQRFKLDGLASVLDKTLLMLVLWGLLYAEALTLSGLAWASIATIGFTVLVFGAGARRLFGPLQWRWSVKRWGYLLRRGAPFAAMMILYSANERLYQPLVERLAGGHEAGLFYAAFRWVIALQMYLWTVLPVFYARFAALKRAPLPQRQALFNAGQVIVAVPIVWVVGVLLFDAPRLFFQFETSTPTELATMSQNLQFLACALLLNGVFNIYSTYLTATGQERPVNRLLVGSVLIGGLIAAVGVPQYGGLAAALGYGLAFLWLSIGYVRLVNRQREIRVPVRVLLGLLLATLTYGASYWGLQQLGLPWGVAPLLGGGVLLGLTLVLRLADWRAVIRP